MSVRERLSQEVPDSVAGAALVMIAIIVLVWGAAMVVSAFDHHGDRCRPRWHWRRWFPCCFRLLFGLFLIVSDAGVYGILGFSVLTSPDGIALWGLLYMIACGVLAAAAFASWAREGLP